MDSAGAYRTVGIILLAIATPGCGDDDSGAPQRGDGTSGGAPVTSTTADPTGVAATTAVSDGSSSTGGSSGSSSVDSSSETTGTTGDPSPRCCSADCSTCGDRCSVETVDSVRDGFFAESIFARGGFVYWASDGQLRRYDPVSEVSVSLASYPFPISALTGNDDALFFGSPDLFYPLINRYDIVAGTTTEIADFGDSASGTGQMAVDESYLYVAYGTDSSADGGVLRFPLDGGPEERVATSPVALGVGVDDEAVYYTDADAARLYALAKADIGTGVEPTELTLTLDPGRLFVGDAHLYYISSTGLDRVTKTGEVFTRVLEVPTRVFGITGDQTHVYATVPGQDRIVRIARGGGMPEVIDIAAEGAVGIATDCDALYWADELELRRQSK